jgi:hypothetical protein
MLEDADLTCYYAVSKDGSDRLAHAGSITLGF